MSHFLFRAPKYIHFFLLCISRLIWNDMQSSLVSGVWYRCVIMQCIQCLACLLFCFFSLLTAGLKLFAKHSSQFGSCLMDHYMSIFDVMSKLCGHINGELKKRSYTALESFLKQVFSVYWLFNVWMFSFLFFMGCLTLWWHLVKLFFSLW